MFRTLLFYFFAFIVYSASGQSINASGLDTIKKRPEMVLQTGHKTLIQSIAVNKSNSIIASGGADGVIKLWDINSKSLLRTIFGHSSWVSTLIFIHNDERLVSSGWDGAINVWDVETGEKISSIDHLGEIRQIAIDSTENLLVSVGANGFVFDISSVFNELWFFNTMSQMTSVAFMPHDLKFAVGGWDSRVHVYDVISKNELNKQYDVDRWIFNVGYSNDGRYLSSVGHEVAVWDLKTNGKIHNPKEFGFCWFSVFNPVSDEIILGFEYDPVVIWNLSTNTTITIPNSDKTSCVGIDQRGDNVIYGGQDGSINIFNIKTQKVFNLKGEQQFASAVKFSPTGKYLATGWGFQNGYYAGVEKPMVRIWDLEKGSQETILFSNAIEEIKNIRFSHNEKTLGVGEGLKVLLWNLRNKTKIANIESYEDDFAFSFDDKYIFVKTSQSKYTLEKWNLKNKISTDNSNKFYWSGFSRNGKWAAIFDDSYRLNVKNLVTDSYVINSKPMGGIGPISISEDGNTIAFVDYGSTVSVYDVKRKIKVFNFPLYENENISEAACISMSPKGDILASAANNRVILWDLKKGGVLHILRDHPGKVLSLDFSPDQSMITTTADGESGILRLWDVNTGELLASLLSLNDGSDWLVISPNGLFDGTWGAISKVGWRVGTTTNVTPIESFYNDYFRPGLLSEFSKGLRPKAKIDIATLLQLPGLRSMISGGLAKIETVNNKSILYFAQRPTARSQVYVDGQLLDFVPEETFDSGNKMWHYKVELPFNAQYEIVNNNIDSNRNTGVANSSRLIKTATNSSTLYVQTIGIDHYDFQNSGFKPLSNSVSGCKKLEDFFISQAQWKGSKTFKSIKVLKGLFDTAATTGAIKKRMRGIAKHVKTDDILLLFLSGHGIVPAGQEMFYFASYDIKGPDPNAQRKTGFNTAMLVDAIRAIPAKRIILFIDACQSGGAIESLKKIADLKSDDENQLRQGLPSKGIFVIVSSSPLEQSLQLKNGASVLALSLLEGFVQPQSSSDNKIWASDLTTFLQKKIPELSAKIGQPHTPMTIFGNIDFPLTNNVFAKWYFQTHPYPKKF